MWSTNSCLRSWASGIVDAPVLQCGVAEDSSVECGSLETGVQRRSRKVRIGEIGIVEGRTPSLCTKKRGIRQVGAGKVSWSFAAILIVICVVGAGHDGVCKVRGLQGRITEIRAEKRSCLEIRVVKCASIGGKIPHRCCREVRSGKVRLGHVGAGTVISKIGGFEVDSPDVGSLELGLGDFRASKISKF